MGWHLILLDGEGILIIEGYAWVAFENNFSRCISSLQKVRVILGWAWGITRLVGNKRA